MGLLDFFRPAWRHSNPDIRLEAVRSLTEEDATTLSEVVIKDPDVRVRRAALKKVREPEVLFDVAAREADATLKELASERAQELLLEASLSADGKHGLSPEDAAKKLEGNQNLIRVACSGASPAACVTAFGRLGSGKSLAQVALKATDVKLRRQAIEKLDDESALALVVREIDIKELALLAVGRLRKEELLAEVARDGKTKAVRQAAKDRLPQDHVAAVEEVMQPTEAKRQRQKLTEICVQFEVVVRGQKDLSIVETKLSAAETRWFDIGRVPGDEAVQKRFAGLKGEVVVRQQAALEAEQAREERSLAETRRKQHQEHKAEKESDKAPPSAPEVEAASTPALPSLPPQRLEGEALIAALTGLCGRLEKVRGGRSVDAEKLDETEARFRKLDEDAPTAQAAVDGPGDDALTAIRRKFFTSVLHLRKTIDEARVAEEIAVKGLAAALERLEKLAPDADKKVLDGVVKIGRAALKQAGAVGLEHPSRAKVHGLLDAANTKLGAILEEERWRRWSNMPKFEQLIKEAETLVEILDTVEDKRNVTAVLKEMQGRWKAAGAPPQDKSQELWDRFRKACDVAFEKCKPHFEAQDAERGENLKKKEALCEKAEGLKESAEWKETSDALKALQEEWKTLGPVPEDQREPIWNRFRAALDHFYGRRAENDKVRDGDREANAKVKEGLCVEAERLAGSRDWKESGEAIKRLQEEWKHSGQAPREKNEELWQRFRIACDRFFEARKGAFEAMDNERRDNLKKKEALIAEAEGLGNDDALSDDAHEEVRRQARELQRRWKLIGHVPREDADAIWARFRAACDKAYETPEDQGFAELPDDATGVMGFTTKLDFSGFTGAGQSAAEVSPTADPSAESSEDSSKDSSGS